MLRRVSAISTIMFMNQGGEAYVRRRTSSMQAIDRGRLRCKSICVFVDRVTDAGWVLVDASGFVGFLNHDFMANGLGNASVSVA
jgi:hypothetical protein